MPTRVIIHSSVVSTIVESSSFVSIYSGTLAEIPVITAFNCLIIFSKLLMKKNPEKRSGHFRVLCFNKIPEIAIMLSHLSLLPVYLCNNHTHHKLCDKHAMLHNLSKVPLLEFLHDHVIDRKSTRLNSSHVKISY